MKSGFKMKPCEDFKMTISNSRRIIQSDFQVDFKLQSMDKHSNK